MRHNYRVDGYAICLRPVNDSDVDFILKLRTDRSRNQFINATSILPDNQLAWLARYYERAGDYYFVAENLVTGLPEGLISLYDIKNESGEWGRWVLREGSPWAAESALLIYRFAFDILGLDTVYCLTVADNSAVVSFHDSCIATHRLPLSGFLELNGTKVECIKHVFAQSSWPELYARLNGPAKLLARRMQRQHG